MISKFEDPYKMILKLFGNFSTIFRSMLGEVFRKYQPGLIFKMALIYKKDI